jgi:hypothetical protein
MADEEFTLILHLLLNGSVHVSILLQNPEN